MSRLRNSRVDVRVDANVDGRAYPLKMGGELNPYIMPCLRKVQLKETYSWWEEFASTGANWKFGIIWRKIMLFSVLPSVRIKTVEL